MFFLNIYRLLSLKGAYSTVYGSPTFPAFLPTEKPTNARFWFNFVGFCLRQQWGTCFSTRLSYCYCCCCSSSSYSYSYCYCYSSCCCWLPLVAGCWLLAACCCCFCCCCCWCYCCRTTSLTPHIYYKSIKSGPRVTRSIFAYGILTQNLRWAYGASSAEKMQMMYGL